VLQDSIGGNAFTMMLACLSPALVNYSETLATLRFASRAKSIKVKVTKNVDPGTARVNALLEEGKLLRERIVALAGLLLKNTPDTAQATIATAVKGAWAAGCA